jgi:hypothetical protein
LAGKSLILLNVAICSGFDKARQVKPRRGSDIVLRGDRWRL